LTVTFLGSGTGTVTFQPSAIICTATCAVSFPVGTAVTVTAATGGGFGGWSSNCPSPNGSACTIPSLTTNLDLTVTFN
jgi:hypothetical protein